MSGLFTKQKKNKTRKAKNKQTMKKKTIEQLFFFSSVAFFRNKKIYQRFPNIRLYSSCTCCARH